MNLTLTICNNKFESSNGEVIEFSPTKVVGLGWNVRITEDVLEAISYQKNDNGIYSIKATLKKGSLLITKRVSFSDGTKKNLGKEEYWIPGINGVLTLSDGNVLDRKITHVHEGMNKFLKAFSIEEIVHSDPNQVYEVNVNAEVYTDGKCSKSLKNKDVSLLEINDATWCIIEEPIDSEENRILYTELPYKKISFPEILSSGGRKKFTFNLKKDFESVEESLEYVNTLNVFKKKVYDFETYICDVCKITASYYLDANGYLSIYISRNVIWNSRDAFEESKANPDLVRETKDYFSKVDRIMEALAYVGV